MVYVETYNQSLNNVRSYCSASYSGLSSNINNSISTNGDRESMKRTYCDLCNKEIIKKDNSELVGITKSINVFIKPFQKEGIGKEADVCRVCLLQKLREVAERESKPKYKVKPCSEVIDSTGLTVEPKLVFKAIVDAFGGKRECSDGDKVLSKL